MLVIAVALALTASHLLGPHILFLSESVLPKINGAVLFMLVAMNDFAVTPVSPDIAIFLISKRSPNDYGLIAALGAASVLGGTMAWVCGRYLESKFKIERLDEFVKANHATINKYGIWIVALGALTPMPYSLACWAAGALKMDFPKFFMMTLLRVPRFLVYFYFFSASAGFARAGM